MPIFQRGNSYTASVGSGVYRYRQTFKTLEEAEQAELEALLRMKNTGSPLLPVEKPKPNGKTLKEAHDMTWRLYWSQNRAQKTHKDACRTIFREIPEGTELTEITPDMVLEAIESWEDQGCSGSTVNRKITHLSMMLKTAMEQGWLKAMPKLPRRAEGKHRIRWLNETEELKVLNLCTHLGLDELRDLVIVAIDTGFRKGELLNLVSNDFVNGVVHLHEGETKNGKARSVPATSRVAEVLTRRSNQRKPFTISVSTLRYHWSVLKAAMGLDDDPQFVFHMLRHTCASRLVQRGVPLAVVQQWMGHSNIATTLRYAHLAPESLNIGRDALEKPMQPVLKVVNG